MSWLGLEAVNVLAERICEDFAKRCPAELLLADTNARAEKKVHAALATVDSNIVTFLASNDRPGLIRKAVCANKVKWGLIERGYPNEVASTVTQKVVLGLSLTSKKS